MRLGRSLLVLVVIVLLASIAAINVQVHVQSYTLPAGWPEGPPYFTLWAVREWDWPYQGYPWEDLWSILDPVFEEIGIDLQIYLLGDMYDKWHLLWEAGLGGRPPGKPPGAWDLTEMEWRLNPQGMLGMDGLILSKNIPPYGNNVFPYLNKKSDELYWRMQTSFDPVVRQRYAFAWQEELMHNPPMINMYYPYVYHVRGRYIQGYDPTVWWYDLSSLCVNVTGLEELLPPNILHRVTEEKTIIYGVAERWWSYLATYVETRTEELYQNLVSGTLYKSSLDPWPAEGKVPPSRDYTLKPWLASEFPQDVGWETDLTDGTQVYRVNVPLKESVLWSDGHPFDAQDVKYTYDLVVNPDVLASAFGDFAPIVKRVEYVNATDPEDPDWDPYSIDLILYEPYVDLPMILANIQGGGILPCHSLSDIPPRQLYLSPENKVFAYAKNVPSIGPYVYDSEGTPAGYTDITFMRNPNYFGYNASIVGEPAWGPYGVEKVIIKHVPDPLVLVAIETHEIDFGEYSIAPVEVFEELKNDPTLLVYVVPHMASNGVWMNLNNPNLSNRYVRLAIAHAVPYERIINEILPEWGVTKTIPGISWITPWHIYAYPENGEVTGYSLFNKDLEPYEYDPVTASAYLEMYLKSRADLYPDQAVGPVGDANFDGKVNLDDLFLLIDKWGETPPYEIDWWPPEGWIGPEVYPWPVEEGASVAPGNDIDIDFDNDGDTADPDDFLFWLYNWGKEYPFPGAR
jgi:ABC-type transport system substrate-binding protein